MAKFIRTLFFVVRKVDIQNDSWLGNSKKVSSQNLKAMTKMATSEMTSGDITAEVDKVGEEKKEDDTEERDMFNSGTWRDKEEPMFDIDVEKDGCMKIMEALTDDEKNNLADDNMPLRHFRADKVNIRSLYVI